MRPALPDTTPILPADDADALAMAAAILAEGGLVAVPTETVYGLAADATQGEAVAGIYEAKGRPRFNPLIAHVDSVERAASLIDLPPLGHQLAKPFWPGPLTLVAKQKDASPVSDLAAAGLQTQAVRVPQSAALTRLIAQLDRPVAAPSANASGQISPTRADHVKASLDGRIHLILDGGPCPVGVESTIVSLIDPDKPALLRPGGLTRESLEAITGPLGHANTAATTAPTAPGQLSSHYAPNATVRLNQSAPSAGEAYLDFGPGRPEFDGPYFNLSKTGSLAQAAANLFTGLRTLDAKAAVIAVAPISETGLGEAINDRPKRAAAPR